MIRQSGVPLIMERNRMSTANGYTLIGRHSFIRVRGIILKECE